MTGVEITAVGSDVDLVIANIRETLDGQLGEGEWTLVEVADGTLNPAIVIALSTGGQIASVKVTMWVVGERLSTRALPREARS